MASKPKWISAISLRWWHHHFHCLHLDQTFTVHRMDAHGCTPLLAPSASYTKTAHNVLPPSGLGSSIKMAMPNLFVIFFHVSKEHVSRHKSNNVCLFLLPSPQKLSATACLRMISFSLSGDVKLPRGRQTRECLLRFQRLTKNSKGKWKYYIFPAVLWLCNNQD